MIRFQKRRAAAALLFAGVLACSGFSACAETPSFGRSEEEWAVLRDNRLEWSEIPDLVAEYNATVKKNEAAYSSDTFRMKNAEATNNELLRMADDYEMRAQQAESTAGGAVTAASYRLQADQLRSQAEENTSDYHVLELQYAREEAEIVQEAQKLFLSYYQAQAEQEQAAQQTAYLSKVYQAALVRETWGTGTKLETLTALENLQKAQAAELSKTAQTEATFRELITLCGWNYGAEAEIGALPAYDAGTLCTLDAAADGARALETSYTLRIDAQKLENAKETSGSSLIAKQESQLAADRNTVSAAYASAKDTLLQAGKAYESASAKAAVQAENLAAAARKRELGLLSELEYAAQENASVTAEGEKTSAWYDLLEARVSYDSTVAGLS